MLRESEPYRRRMRDDAETDHVKWERYRDGKRRIEDMPLSPEEHEARVKALARELGV